MMSRVEKKGEMTTVLNVKKSKEYKLSIVLSSVAFVLLSVALVVGLVEIDTYVERICFFLGISLNCFGFALWMKSAEKNNENK